MKSFQELKNEHPAWIQPKAMQQLFELRSQENLFCTLTFSKSSGSLAEAESYDGKWTFKRVEFFHTSFTIREFGKEKDIAVFRPKWTGNSGSLEFVNGKTFHWQSSNFWSTKFEFKKGDGDAVVTFRSGVDEPKLKDWFKTQARIEIPESSKNIHELSILILLGWYLIIVLQMDSSAGAVVAATS